WQVRDDPLSLRQDYDAAIAKWLTAKGLSPKEIGTPEQPGNRNVLVLWSRFSGKKGRLHPEHDTSYTGMAQLVETALTCMDIIVIAGDKPPEEGLESDKLSRRKVKYSELVKQYSKNAKRVVDLTEFW